MTDNPYNSYNSDHTNNPDNSDSLSAALKSAGEAFLNAGSRLGDLAGEFGRNFRADREASASAGAHAVGGDEVTADNAGLSEQFKAAIANARKAYEGAENDKDFRAATASFAGDAESIFRDFAGSVTRAADTARESGHTDNVKSAFNEVVAEAREAFNAAVAQIRGGEKADSDQADAENAIADMRTRFEELVSRVSESIGASEKSDSEKNPAEGQADPTDIIDGEIVDVDEDTERP